jgi:hypothetical protein
VDPVSFELTPPPVGAALSQLSYGPKLVPIYYREEKWACAKWPIFVVAWALGE